MNRNRLYNTQNQYQRFDKYKRVLCVCSAGLLRSPTIARVLQEEYGYNTRAAGVDTSFALIPMDGYLLDWADEIVCASQEHATALAPFIPEGKNIRNLVVLNIPDEYEYMDDKLVAIIKERYKKCLSTK